VIAYAHYRRGGADGREPIAGPDEIVSIAKNYTPQQQFWGKVTSRRPQPTNTADIELVAFQLGCSVEAARRAIKFGLI
jgi:NACalpha-BTF3-like transcription factor